MAHQARAKSAHSTMTIQSVVGGGKREKKEENHRMQKISVPKQIQDFSVAEHAEESETTKRDFIFILRYLNLQFELQRSFFSTPDGQQARKRDKSAKFIELFMSPQSGFFAFTCIHRYDLHKSHNQISKLADFFLSPRYVHLVKSTHKF